MPTPARPSKPAPVRHEITLELLAAALECVPADAPHDDAVRVAFALFDGGGDAAEPLWLRWRERRTKPEPVEDRAIWKSARKPGAVKVATLFGMARANGFKFPEGQPLVQTPAQVAAALAQAERLAAERRKQREIEAVQYSERADKTARHARAMWDAASETCAVPSYPDRKGVGKHGVRFLVDGTMLAPLRNAEGEIENLQLIKPQKPADGSPDKKYLPGGRKAGLWHLIGQAEGAAAILVAEGYGTAASLHDATGRPAVLSFDCGNLPAVVKALHAKYPAAALLVAGDDDIGTQARTGKNPGRLKAAQAVRAGRAAGARCDMVFPQDLRDAESDFNDVMQRTGPAPVREAIEAACTALLASSVDEGVADPDALNEPPRPSAEPGRDGDPFVLDKTGVWFSGRDREGNAKKPQWLCAPLEVTARTRADDTNGWGFLLRFQDPDSNPKSWAMPSALLSGDGGEWAARLRDMGLRMAPGTAARNLIARYLDTRESTERVTCTSVVGWHGPVFVLPSCSIGSVPGRTFVFQSDTGTEDTLRRSGTLAQWKTEVAAPCVGNSRLLFALGCAFGGPLLHLAGVESGVMSLTGGSSGGKTSSLRAAASVYGRPSYMKNWRATGNALESTAVEASDLVLILDEAAQVDLREIGEIAYMLANGMEKGRSTRNGLGRKRRTWRVLVLSSSEVSLPDLMVEGGRRTRAGQEVRFLDVPIDAGAGMGGFEVLHGHDGPGALAEAVTRAAATYYGTAGRTWLEWLCKHHATVCGRLPALIEKHRADMVPEAAAAQVRRAGTRFALVAAAGELATEAGITGWAKGEAAQGVRKCFNAWLATRGHLDNGEDAAMLHQVRQFLELHSEGRFTWWHRAADDHNPKTLNRAGFRRLIGDDGKPVKSDADHHREYGERINASDGERAHIDFIVLREVFQREVCRGYNPDEVARLLQRRGHLVHEPGRLKDRQRLPGMGKAACYHVKPSIFDDEL
jgi:putative DNA primase/helicase